MNRVLHYESEPATFDKIVFYLALWVKVVWLTTSVHKIKVIFGCNCNYFNVTIFKAFPEPLYTYEMI